MERIDLRVHPLVLELTGKKEPADGLQGKFSVYHGCSGGLIYGRAGEDEYADEIVTREDVVALRRKVQAVVDTSIHEDSADVTATLKDGRTVHVFVEHAIGRCTCPRKRRPSGVRCTPCVVRSNSRTPSCSSRCAMRRDSAGCDRCKALAAPAKLHSSPTVTKARRSPIDGFTAVPQPAGSGSGSSMLAIRRERPESTCCSAALRARAASAAAIAS